MFSVGVIGLGMGRDHLEQYARIAGVRIAAIADLDAARLESARTQFQVPRACADYHELLSMAEIDSLSICLPNHLHASVTIEALKAGKHVLIEKPMAMNAKEGQSMIEAARSSGRTLALAMNYRWHFGPDTLYLKQQIEAGALGTVYYIRSQSLRRRTFAPGHKSWFSQKAKSGGGALIDMGPHLLDLAMWFSGDFRPVSASGCVRTAIMTDTDIDDLAVGLVRLSGGATVALESTWASHTRPGVFVTVMGTKGGAVLELGAPAGQRLTFFGAQGPAFTEMRPVEIHLEPGFDASVQAHFVRCIQSGIPPQNSAECGVAVMRILDAVYESSRAGVEVKIG
jgi:predicted dehydrogenase